MLNFIRKVDYYGTLIISKDVDLDFVKEIIEKLGCSICLISSSVKTYKFAIEGAGNYSEDIIQDFLEEITPLTKAGYILYRMPDGTKWRHCFNTNCHEWVEENLEYNRSANGKKEAIAELMRMNAFYPSDSVVIINPLPGWRVITLE